MTWFLVVVTILIGFGPINVSENEFATEAGCYAAMDLVVANMPPITPANPLQYLVICEPREPVAEPAPQRPETPAA
jgi:hypothetical protein